MVRSWEPAKGMPLGKLHLPAFDGNFWGSIQTGAAILPQLSFRNDFENAWIVSVMDGAAKCPQRCGGQACPSKGGWRGGG